VHPQCYFRITCRLIPPYDVTRPTLVTMRRRSRQRSAAHQLLEAGVVDAEFYRAQVWLDHGSAARLETDGEAAEHWVSLGHRRFSPHPLIGRAALPERVRRAIESDGLAPLLDHLRRGGSTRRLSPVFDASAASTGPVHPHPGGALGAFLTGARPDDVLPGSAHTLTQVRAAVRTLVEPAAPAAVAGPPTADQVSVVGVLGSDPVAARVAVRRHLDELTRSAGAGEVVLTGDAPRLDTAHDLALRFVGDPRVRVLLSAGEQSRATLLSRAADLSVGEFTLLAEDLALPRDGALALLLAALADPDVFAAQPLILDETDRVVSAGWLLAAPDVTPTHALAGLSREDALRAGPGPVTAGSGLALAVRTRDLAALGGIDPTFGTGWYDVDLCWRARQAGMGVVVLDPASVFSQTAVPPTPNAEDGDHVLKAWGGRSPAPDVSVWSRAGLGIGGTRGAGERPRWGLRIAAPGGAGGERWGDTHFARSLASALERAGAQAVVHTAQAGAPAIADDVTLTLRGLNAMPPVPGSVNVLWVISHPDEVTEDEMAGYHLVLAASGAWAEANSRPGRTVLPLLQATDTTLAAEATLGDGTRPVFVGAALPDRPRPVVEAAVAAGVPVVVHGPGWRERLPPENLGADYVPNEDLAATYRAAGLVLADHWPDMATQGFIANRVFDAVAAGARVISDPVAGLETFDGAVQIFESPEHLAYLCSPRGRDAFPPDDEIATIAARVAREHSFDARAATLLDAVRTAGTP
jgi:hypothetical protein